jgi:twitching motility protein PilI
MSAAWKSPFDVLADYEQRSLTHVAGLPEQIDAPGLWRGIGYRIGSRRLASGFGEVVEIISVPSLTPVPGGDNWLLGVANIRSNLLPVVDLKMFLEGERTVQHATMRALVIRQGGGNVAVVIDELYGQRNFIDENRAELDGVDDGRYGAFVKQAYRLGDSLWGVFSMALLTRTPEFRQAAAA